MALSFSFKTVTSYTYCDRSENEPVYYFKEKVRLMVIRMLKVKKHKK